MRRKIKTDNHNQHISIWNSMSIKQIVFLLVQ